MKTWLAVLACSLVAGSASADQVQRSEQAYLRALDVQLLPMLASAYRQAAKPTDALRSFCEYLAAQPKGAQAAFAANQVIALRLELGLPVANTDVCAPAQPMRIDTVTPRRGAKVRASIIIART